MDAKDWLLGGLSAGGAILTNASARNEAKKNRDFQERMSSTAAQRSVADYKAAGLNPALAYERTASSPGGAQAVIGDAVNTGINSARSSSIAREQLRTAQAQATIAELDAKFARETYGQRVTRNAAETDIASTASYEAGRKREFEIATQPYQEKLLQWNSLMAEYGVPPAQATAEFYKRFGSAAVGLTMGTGVVGGLAGAVAGVSRAVTSAKAAKAAADIAARRLRSGSNTVIRSGKRTTTIDRRPTP